MRIGRNPLSRKQINATPPVVCAAITHLPNQEGYHSNRLEVIQLSLRSMREMAGREVATLIWDNGSCPALTEWLLYEYKPDTLILSPNIGKSNARVAVFGMFPPETILALADDDMLYFPDWLVKQIEVLDHFPRVGCVTGNPVRTQFRWGCENTIAWAHKNASLEVGKLIPEQWDYDFCTSIGREYHEQLKHTVDDMDYLITYQGMKAWAHGHHCQFTCYVSRLARFAQRSDFAMDDEKPFDISIDQAGLLRLATYERTTRHIGNCLDEGVMKDALNIGLLQGVRI